MPEAAGTDSKSPKTQRRPKSGGDLPRQVHFTTVEDVSEQGSNNNATKSSTANSKDPVVESSQPSSFPQVGPPPGHGTAAGTQWHTSSDPSRSLSLPGQPQTVGGCFVLPQNQHGAGFFTHHGPVTYIPHSSPHHHAASPPVTYIGLHPTHQPATAAAHQVHAMADYQNTAPPPMGLNFQPPVPDTTFGPMQHVYVPRFDGGFVPGVQVGLPPMQHLPPTHPQACARLVVPNVFYYVYYASCPLLPVGVLYLKCFWHWRCCDFSVDQVA